MVDIRKAHNKDMSAVLKIYDDARMEMKASGINQWQKSGPVWESLLYDLSKDNLYVATVGDKTIGVFALEGEDENYKKVYLGNWVWDEKYFSIHRFAVAKEFLCKGYGKRIFDKIFILAKNDVKLLRIDTHIENFKMRKLIEGTGFEFRGIVIIKDGTERLCYEKRIK